MAAIVHKVIAEDTAARFHRFTMSLGRGDDENAGSVVVRHQVSAGFINADDLTATEQHDEAHVIKPCVGQVRIAAEHVKVGPAAGNRLGGPSVEEIAGGINDPVPSTHRETGRHRHRTECSITFRPSAGNVSAVLDQGGAFLRIIALYSLG